MRRTGIGLVVLLLAAAPRAVDPTIAAWAFPDHREPQPIGGWDATTPLGVPGSTNRFTAAQLHDLGHAVDWKPSRHPAMPEVVTAGHGPTVKACGFCHLPDGSGRVENASLSGLPPAYVDEQVAAFAAGTRRAVVPGWAPSALMAGVAHAASPAEVHAAAVYFGRLRYRTHLRVVESATVPMTVATNFNLVARGGREAIGNRIVEVPDDVERFERRDAAVTYTAYVPPGSRARGAAIATRIGCAGCHGAGMRLWGAGRSPTYIFRQLLAFKTGARHNAEAAPMTAVAVQLAPSDMVAVAAYWGSLTP